MGNSSDDVQRAVTHSDGSFEHTLSLSTESRDDDDQHEDVAASRREGNPIRSKTSVTNEDSLDLDSNPRLLPSPTVSFDYQDTKTTEKTKVATQWTQETKGNSTISATQWPEEHSTPSSPSREAQTPSKDDASFSIFGHSFDSISHTTDIHDVAFRSSPPRRGIDIALPTLGGDGMDISPIKLDHHADEPTKDLSYLLTEPLESFHHASYHQSHRYSNAEPPPPPPLKPMPPPHSARWDNTFTPYPPDTYSNPYYVLRSCSQAFRECTFRLSHVRNPQPLPVHFSGAGSYCHYQNQGNIDREAYSADDLVIATRRVKTAVCFFGGTAGFPRLHFQRDRDAIFRGVNRWNHEYEARLPQRYHMNGASQISWDMEEHPPVHVDAGRGIQKKPAAAMIQLSPEGPCGRDSTLMNSPSSSERDSGTEPPKMKYRCKLCGQPKQNHSCPYRQSMQRSIGVTVQPAVNAFTAHEPGTLAPALSEMNNFVENIPSVDSSKHSEMPSRQVSPHDAQPDPLHSPNVSVSVANEVTPPSSSGATVVVAGGKRKHSEAIKEENRATSPFADEAPLCREQYRAVSTTFKEGDFQYPPVPLSFPERKRLSDTLFFLSREIQYLTEEVASILHEARERELWDLAVSEVMTQVVVALYCGEGDKRLDGLQQYLLAIGIAC